MTRKALLLLCGSCPRLLLTFLAVLTLATTACAQKKLVFEYQNPITSGIDTLGIRDCHVFRDGDSWYMTGTAYPFWRRQEEGGKPLNAGVPLYRSDDLLHWQFVDYIVRRPSADKWYYRNFWAPEIRHIKGKYYCTFNCANADAGYKGIFCGYAVSDRLTGPYRVVTEEKPLSQGNDLTLFEEEDGTVWAFWNRGSDVGIIQSRIDLEQGRLLDKPKVVIPCGGKGEWDNIGIEGSCVFKRDGRYYLLYSSWTRGYEIGCATAPSITGPWTKCDENPIYGAQDPEVCKKRHIEAEVVEGSPFTQVGHNQVFIGPTGDYWLSCHGNIVSNPEHPMLVIDPLKFSADGQVQRIIPSFTKQTIPLTAAWIWYPGDMDIWTGNRINDLRTENGSYYPAFWRNDYHSQTVEFSKTVQLDEQEEVAIAVEGKYGIRIDSHGYLFGMPKTFTVPKGRHTLRISVNNMTSPPAIWLKGRTIVSDTSWTVTDFADGRRADTWYEMDGTPTFAEANARPSDYHLPTTPIQPIRQQKDGNTLFAEFAREGIGYLQLDGVRGNGQVNICYGESPDEARDKQHAYLKDRVLFTQDSVIDMQSLIVSQRQGSSYRLPSSRAMRYVTVETEGGISIEGVTLQSEKKNVPRRGSFTCSDTLLNHIWDVSAYTLHLTDREVMIEGIKRDRWMWSGDAIQSYLMNYYAFMDAPVVRRTIWALRGKDPVRQHINTILDYTFYWFNSVYDYYLYTGDSRFLRSIYPRMQSLMAWVEGRLNGRGMVEGKKGDWVFVDWSPQQMSKSGELAFEQMVYLRSLEAMRLCAGIVGNKADAEKYGKRADDLRMLLTPVFWNGSAFAHTCEKGRLSQEVTRYANIFAVLYGYADKEQATSILNNVLLNDSVMPITTPYMRFYELEALCALGQQQRVLKEMRAYWGGMLREGATTFWETYDPKEQYPQRLAMYGHRYGKSLCHAWGASPIYLLGKYYLGIQPTKPGYEAWECRPCLGDLKWMKGDVPTPRGNIHVEMTRKQVTIEATGCGTGTLIVGKKRVEVKPDKRMVIKY